MDYIAIAHQYLEAHHNAALALAFAGGAVASHPVFLADMAFKAIIKTPLKYPFLANRIKINEWIDAFQTEIDKQAAKEAEKAATKAADAATPPTSPNP